MRCALAALSALSMLCPGISTAADSPFAHSAEIEPDIQFWERVYTEVTTNGGLVHDDRKLGVVYEVIRFPENLPRAERQRQVERAKDKYSAILKHLANGYPATSADEKRVRALWPESTSPRALHDAAERVRFQLGQSDRFRAGLVRAGTYEAHIAETFATIAMRVLPRPP